MEFILPSSTGAGYRAGRFTHAYQRCGCGEIAGKINREADYCERRSIAFAPTRAESGVVRAFAAMVERRRA
jgi:hypothetical protein